MNTKTRLATITFCIATTLSAGGMAQDLALYDTFRGVRINGIPGRVIDPSLWEAWNSRGAHDVTRRIAGGRAILGTVTHGGTGSDSGRGNGRSALPFPESVGALITDIQATVQTSKTGLTDCAANGANGRLLTPRIGGNFFSDGTAPAHDEDLTGSMWASLDILRRNSFDDIEIPDGADRATRRRLATLRRNNGLEVTAQVFQCGNEDCSDGTTIGFESLGVIRRGHRRRVHLQWDEPNNQFLFQLHRNPPVAITYAPELNAGPPPKFWKRIEHRGQPEHCDLGADPTADRTTIAGEVRIFDVRVNADAIAD